MLLLADSGEGSQPKSFNDISRKEMGLEWMLRPKDSIEGTPATTSANQMEEVQPATEEVNFQCT